jgi:hypothetical protein
MICWYHDVKVHYFEELHYEATIMAEALSGKRDHALLRQ